MRLLFFILILANVATLGFFTYREQHLEASKSAQAHSPWNADHVRTVSAAAPDNKTEATSAKLSCWSWYASKPDDTVAIRAALDKLALGDKLTQSTPDEYLLAIPGLKTKKDAEKKLAELKALGVTDAELQEDTAKHSVSLVLGKFPDEDAATVRLNQLKEKGVKSTVVSRQAGPSAHFFIKQVDEKTAATLSQTAAGFSASEFKSAPCPGA